MQKKEGSGRTGNVRTNQQRGSRFTFPKAQPEKKWLLSVLLTLCMVLCLFPIQAFADDMPTVSLDVGMENAENEDCKVRDATISLSKEGQVYKLTCTTGKKIRIWGSSRPDPVKTFYLQLNNATTYDVALCTTASLSVSGGRITAKSENASGIYAGGNTSISSASTVTRGNSNGIYSDSISNSVRFNGSTGTVIGSAAILADVSVNSGMTLDIPEGTTLTVPDGKTLTNNGTINRTGTIERLGTIICNSHNGGKATCKGKAVCEVCGETIAALTRGKRDNF